MAAGIVTDLGIIAILVLANALLAAAEIAIVASRKSLLQQQADAGDWSAKLALELSANPNRFLPAVQLGITLIGVCAAVVGGAMLGDKMTAAFQLWPLIAGAAAALSFVAVVVLVTVLSVVFGELVPKRLAMRNPSFLARIVAVPMHGLAVLMWPLVWILSATADRLLRLFGIQPEAEPKVMREDIEQLIEQGASGGILDPVEHQVAIEALRLGDRAVRDIMQPRIDIDGMEASTPPAEVLGVIAMAGFSRIPVYEGDLDHIIGFVHVKDVLRQIHLGWSLNLRRLLRPAMFVPETLPLDRLMVMFREKRTHLAIVLDEFGGTEGLVTLDSLLEELVGKMHDEHSRDAEQEMVKRADGSWLIDGKVNLEDLLEHVEYRGAAPPAARDYSTLAGLILAELGRIPSVGDRLAWQGLELEIVDMDGPRIDRILVTLPAPDAATAPKGEA